MIVLLARFIKLFPILAFSTVNGGILISVLLFPESPMILDVSVEEKKPIDREAVILTVPEYEEDIYQYLRQAEVFMIYIDKLQSSLKVI